MARSGLRIFRFVSIAAALVFILYKLSVQRVDISDYVNSRTSPSTTNKDDQPITVVSPEIKKPDSAYQEKEKKPEPTTSLVDDFHTDPKTYDRANATFVTLARNEDLWTLVESIREVEDRFNGRYGYDWVFLNDKEFDDEFKKVTTSLISGTTHYGKIDESQWGFPEWIDKEKAALVREDMRQRQIIYGDSISYRHMCRYESGFFWRHPLMMNYKYYWRVEPDIKLLCDIPYDLFKFMEAKKKAYAFTISLYEYIETIPTLWETTKEFIKQHPEYVASDNAMEFISDDQGETYNKCHFWSNFEIADLDFWRGDAYTAYFEFLDQKGGFFYERWGDAPVHSIAAALFLNKDQIHFFDEVGYWHVPFTNCPTTEEDRSRLRCICKPEENFTWKGYSCTPRYYNMNKLTRPKGWADQA